MLAAGPPSSNFPHCRRGRADRDALVDTEHDSACARQLRRRPLADWRPIDRLETVWLIAPETINDV